MRGQLCLVWLLLCSLTMWTPSDVAANADSLLVPAKRFPLAGHVYIIDPGHGGEDPGTKHEWPPGQTGKHRSYLYEEQFTLGLAIKQMNKIKDLGGTVVLTVLIPDNLTYIPFGTDSIPSQGAERFNLTSRPVIKAGADGLSKRLQVGQLVLDQYPEKEVHWLSLHFDWVRQPSGHDPVSGTRIFFSTETQETTFVTVDRLVQKRVRVDGQLVRRPVWTTADSIVAINPSRFVRDLAQSFTDAGWLRAPKQQPVVASGKIRYLFILHGENDPKRIGKRRHSQRVYNQVVDRVLIEYANFKSEADWARLQQPAGSLERLAEITVQGLVKHAHHDDITQRDR